MLDIGYRVRLILQFVTSAPTRWSPHMMFGVPTPPLAIIQSIIFPFNQASLLVFKLVHPFHIEWPS